VALTALGTLHLVMLLVLAGHLVAVLDNARTTRSWRPLLEPAVALLTAVSLLIPLILRGHTQTGAQLGSTHRTNLYLIADLPAGICCGAVAAAALLVLAAVGALTAGHTGRVFGLLTLAPIAAFAVLALFVPVFNHRYVLFVTPLACVLAGLALTRLRLHLGLALVLLLALITLPEQAAVRRSHEQTSSPLIDYRAAARVISNGRQPGDTIVYQRSGWQFVDIATEYYLRRDTPTDILAATSRDAAGSFWTPQVTRPDAALAGVVRIWEVVPDRLSDHKPQPLPAGTRNALARAFRQSGRWRVSGITIFLLQRRTGVR
jgi:mannosyltransferase